MPTDVVRWRGRIYLPDPFLPAMLLVPFVFVHGYGAYEGILSPVLGMMNLLLFQRVLVRAHCAPSLRPWLLLLFGLGSLQLSTVAIGGNWLLSHVVTMMFVLILLWEALGATRGEVLALAVGLASLSRPSVLAVLPFCILAGWARDKHGMQFLVHCGRVVVGLVPVLAVWLWYNWARFGQPFETGYEALILPYCLDEIRRSHGLFSLAYVPKNLYLMLLQGPQPIGNVPNVVNAVVQGPCASVTTANLDAATLTFPWVRPSEWGMGILFTTPAFLFVCATRLLNRWALAYWASVLSSTAVILTYYSPGWIQWHSHSESCNGRC